MTRAIRCKLVLEDSESESDNDIDDDLFSEDDPEYRFRGWHYSKDQREQLWLKCSKCFIRLNDVFHSVIDEF